MKFFNSSAILKELKLLEFIERNPSDTSQQEMAKAIGAAASSVNGYLGRFEERGYLVRDYKSQRVVNYLLTPEGIKRKNYLSIIYYNELLLLYRLAELNIERFLDKLEDKGYKKVLFYGAGEVAETILPIVEKRESRPLEVLAIVDDKKSDKFNELFGYKVISRNEMDEYNHDGVVITSYSFEDEIKKKLEEVAYPQDRIELFFSGM